MTGYGEARRETPAGTLLVEVRTVNHRHFSANLRLPQALSRWEGEIREWLRGQLPRGHANVSVKLEAPDGTPRGLRLDDERVQTYLTLFTQLRERFGVQGEADLRTLARFNDIFVRDDGDAATAEISADDVRAAVDDAARANVRMREGEGRRLHDDLEGRVAAMEAHLDEIARLAPERLVSERDRLKNAIHELAGGVGVDEQRLAQELVYIAERLDINEELVRFRAHNAAFRELLDADSAEPVGKRLGFLVQEMHREANTIGSKANHAGIAHRVVAIKEEVERLREQVENVE